MSSPGDPLARLRALTPARVGLGRCGDGLPLRALLDFELAHARARDAVRVELDPEALCEEAARRLPGRRCQVVRSAASDRATYLQRPDLGARLHPDDVATLVPGEYDLCVVFADGLSAGAVRRHAVPTAAALLDAHPGCSVAPLVVAQRARVALGDPVAERLGARLVVVLIGERPGLSSPESLGAYLTFDPRPGRTNAERNCVSNIRPDGLAPAAAGARLAILAAAALRLGLSGVGLKDRSGRELPGSAAAAIE